MAEDDKADYLNEIKVFRKQRTRPFVMLNTHLTGNVLAHFMNPDIITEKNSGE